jgi:hypothetical protein
MALVLIGTAPKNDEYFLLNIVEMSEDGNVDLYVVQPDTESFTVVLLSLSL